MATTKTDPNDDLQIINTQIEQIKQFKKIPNSMMSVGEIIFGRAQWRNW